MLSIDWSHTKGLATYDGKGVRIEDRQTLLKRLAEESNRSIESNQRFNSASSGVGGEFIVTLKSNSNFNPPTPLIILEQECPLSLIYDILKTGCLVNLINAFEVKSYREAKSWDKTDENDAIAIYELAQRNPGILSVINLNDDQIQLVELYQRYKRYQKARVAMVNMKKAYVRQFGEDGESTKPIKSSPDFNPSPVIEGEGESTVNIVSTTIFNPSPSDGTLPYDIGIDTLKSAEKDCLKKIIKLAPSVPEGLEIRGLGPRLWAGIYIAANPAHFQTLSSYLRYCGLVDKEQIGTKWNRHACMLYRLLAEEVVKCNDDRFCPIYYRCKEDIAERYPEYTKLHIHNAALNRTATFLAKEIWGLLGNVV